MSFIKRIAEVIVRSKGYPIPTDNSSVSGNKPSVFNQILSNSQQSLRIPTPPAPPADPNDLEAQQTYNKALLKYNQRFQGYHTQVLQSMFQRMMMMQQTMMQAQRFQQQNTSTNQSSLASSGRSGVGGILGGDV